MNARQEPGPTPPTTFEPSPSRWQDDLEGTFPMVSHPEVAERPRRASSIASRSRRSSHHRGHSHHGGTQNVPQNEFPIFSMTGDVELVIACDGREKRYLLHRLMLAQASGFFQNAIGDEWPRSQGPSRAHGLIIGPYSQALGGEASSAVSAPPGAPEQVTKASDPRKRWRFELDWENVNDDEEPMLVQTPPQGGLFLTSMPPPPVSSRPPPTTNNSFFRSMANLGLGPSNIRHPSQSTANVAVSQQLDPAASSPVLRDYDNLFRTFYNYAPILNSMNIASAYSECKSLLALADLYDALHVVGERVEHHLLRFSNRLFKQIAKYPPSYLKLGYLARSRTIFSEALVHVVGQWPAGYNALKPSEHPGTNYDVPIQVLDLIEDKAEELEEMKGKIEAKLFRLTLTTSRGDRVNPSNDYLGWLAMSLWRQWLAENTTPEIRGILKNSPNPGHARTSSRGSNRTAGPASGATPTFAPVPSSTRPAPPPNNFDRVYRLIGSIDSQSFLPHDELKRFLKLYPTSSSTSNLYTRDNLKRFERKMEEIKNVARDLVKPLTRSVLELDIRTLSDGQGGGLGYLTCMRVEESELPWN